MVHVKKRQWKHIEMEKEKEIEKKKKKKDRLFYHNINLRISVE